MEVGAVRFNEDSVLDTFQTFVNPRRHIPFEIQRLTGIKPADLEGAPSFAEIASELKAFVGNEPVVGQNVSFDLNFLSWRGIRPPGPVFDTFELGRLLLTELTSYGLGALANHLDVRPSARHRALADAETACRVFLALRSRLASLPSATLETAERLAAAGDWSLRHLFRQVLEDRAGPDAPEPDENEVAPRLGEPALGLVRRPPDLAPALVPSAERRAVTPDEVERLLEQLATKGDILPQFERRPEQTVMARAVAEALADGEHLIVEAGTGTGKSLAYLVPAACHALRNNERVVVSTNTISLQEQLRGQDIPVLRRLLEDWSPDGDGARSDGADRLRATQLKGRRNYLCLLRWAAHLRSQTLTTEEAKLLVRLLLWLPRTDTGDRAELNLTPEEENVWRRLSAQNESCLASACYYVREGTCFLWRARKRAEAAHLLVVNHALLLSDVAAGGRVLPPFSHLVIDEAHHLEEEATQQFGFQAGESDLIDFLDRVHQRLGRGREGGLTGSLRQSIRGVQSALAPASLLSLAQALADSAGRVRERLPTLFDLLSAFVRQQSAEEGDYDQKLLLSRSMRVQPDWTPVEIIWESADVALRELLNLLGKLQGALQEAEGYGLLDYEALVAEVGDLIQSGQQLREGLNSIIAVGDPGTICWLTAGRGDRAVTVASAPLDVAEALRDGLLSQKEGVILTGATLSSQGSFDYLAQRLGLERPRELLLGSPFDYEHSTLMLLPQDIPEPSDPRYHAALERALIELSQASEGRALVLFTSHAALRAAHAAIKGPLEGQEILVLGQGIDGPPKQMLQVLRENSRTVLLGAASFWEGVDIMGEALSLLVITRLPFSVPTDPVFAARSELFDDPFIQYALPQATLRFKQGFGRLIRRKTDRGVVAVLDRRILSKSYGSAFLRSLPACTVEERLLRQFPEAVGRWLTADAPKR
jgi:predicted DnaQ family exonuclease/DinG family helicase